MLRSALLAAVLLALPSCSLGGSDAIGITGIWEGEVFSAEPGATRYPVELRLTDTGQFVSGTGSVELPGERFEFSISKGSFVGGVVNLDTRFDEPPFMGGIDGSLTETSPGRIEGTFIGRDQVGNSRIDVELVDR